MPSQHPLTPSEIHTFVSALDLDSDNTISYAELAQKLDKVHAEIAPVPKPHNLHHASRNGASRHAFLRSVIGSANRDRIPRHEFEDCVRSWDIPSLEQDRREAKDEDAYVRGMSVWRRARAWCGVAACMGGFGGRQLGKYLGSLAYRDAFGWGVVVSKTAAGALYPTFFFLVLSMSRWFSTFMRRFNHVSRFVNWDVGQGFHVKMSVVALGFASLHAVGHLAGSFVWGSMRHRQDGVADVLGVTRTYADYVGSLPGITGLAALACFYLLALLSMPQVRKWSYEVFQLGHLLMFPIIGLMMAHGTAGLLQWPMFGYWLAFPTLLVVCERSWRVFMGFRHIEAELELLDEETMAITATIPKTRLWPYKAGQYVLIQVPSISWFQWHPFTVSTCTGNSMQVHIKADGDWTNALRDIAQTTPGHRTTLKIGLDGPFGAPAQRFYDFEYAMVFGAGIGVTPFSGILTDLQTHELERSRSRSQSADDKTASPYKDHRRIDFHWMVRDKDNLLWFSDLLNEVSRANQQDKSHLDIRIQTYVTQKRKDISTHVFR